MLSYAMDPPHVDRGTKGKRKETAEGVLQMPESHAASNFHLMWTGGEYQHEKTWALSIARSQENDGHCVFQWPRGAFLEYLVPKPVHGDKLLCWREYW
jgi:hypothetical protein